MAISIRTEGARAPDRVITQQRVLSVTGSAIVIRGDNIDTDRIIPARYLKGITFEGLGAYAFYDERFDEQGNRRDHPFNDPRRAGASVLVVNRNFGCGSSREHAPQALMRRGIRAVIGESFAEIFADNCAQIGVAAVTMNEADVAALMGFAEAHPKEQVSVALAEGRVAWGGNAVPCAMDAAKKADLAGGTWDATTALLEAGSAIEEAAARLPYLAFNRKGTGRDGGAP